MTIRNFDKLMKPASVALIGASPKRDSVGGVLTRNLLHQFKGPVGLVNPRHADIFGRPVAASASALGFVPDLAVVATPAPTVPAIIAELGAIGCKAAVVIGNGFGSSAEGRALTQAMLDAARPHLLRILGPNCVGLMLPGLSLNASFAHLDPLRGPIAFLSQSGAIITSVLDWAKPRGIGFSCMVSMGEMADVDFGDMLDHLASDPETRAILLYVEAVTHARKFMSAARIAARSKPVIVIKAGRFAETAKAVASHTGSMAGADAVYDAAFRRAGMLRVFSLDELFAAAETLGSGRRIAGDRLAILTNGGGIGILATDELAAQNGKLAELSPGTQAMLEAVLPPSWSHGNPVDIIGDAPPERYAQAIGPLLTDPGSDVLLVLNCPTAVAPSVKSAARVIEAVKKAERPVLVSWIGEQDARDARQLFAAAHIPSYETPEQAVRGFMHLVRYRRNQDMLMQTPPSVPEQFATDLPTAQAAIASALEAGHNLIQGPEAQAILKAFAIPTVESIVAATGAEAADAQRRIGQPVALKIRSPDISHKSDVGGVSLNLESPSDVAVAVLAMRERVERLSPGARIEGFTVEPMIHRATAHELILGLTDDPTFGPVVLFGSGGTSVEVVADRAIALPPLNMALARELMARTRIFRLLQGYRDRPAADLDAIALTLVKLSQIAIDLPDVAELDINPLLADAKGVLAVDSRLRLKPAARPGSSRLAIRPYPRRLEEPFPMPDGGGTLLLRPILPEDEPQLAAAFARMSPESVRMRFFAPLKEVPPYLRARLTQIDYEREMALVLVGPGPAGQAEIFAVVRISADPDNDSAEFAIAVLDQLAGHGIGTRLMEKIIAYARGRGIRRIVGIVLNENLAMIDICRRLGFRTELESDRADALRVTLDLAAPGPAAS
ncbi:GCN5 family N-acetyltransferase [Hypericibacter adhaerens]|jgi:acetyltransferase|uniref:GCN5 family N-acetyltransferase n=1 Tax=Hypericibacter adhaerens TaxID=2602016 RepID=A0A5J6MWP8_9PROT|nr:bifunctional acetate--CoA ligase family protein/GNAT family N-acetyltransferase [Hypericibacter adhaerens]QEX22068.1 GCN5 family N-acetyltransferase [Hypericibacter adhaerens]